MPDTIHGASASYSAAVLRDAPAGYWRLDEPSGSSVADSSGHAHSGAYVGNVIHAAAGALSGDPDTATQFDGVTSAAAINLDLSTVSSTSVEFWLNWKTYANDDRLALEFGNTFQDVPGFLVDPNSSTVPGKFEVALGDGSGGTANNVFFNRPSAGAWHHYVLVLSRLAPAASAIIPYVDGTAVSYTKTASTQLTGNFASSTLFTMSRDATSLFGAGTLDELAVFPSTLTAAQVAAHYGAGRNTAVPPAPTSTVPTPTATNTVPSPTATNTVPSPTATNTVAPPPAPTRTPAPVTQQTFTTSPLARASTELPNSLRGEYSWYSDPVDPGNWPYQDSYTRYDWKQIEPTQNNYDFSSIDAELAAAKARGGRFGFRIMAACTGCYSGGASVPDYIVNAGGGQWVADSGSSFYIPDWNSNLYLSRVEALMTALGNRYRTDKRLGWIDMMGYGNWGEWHDWPYSPNPLLSAASGQRIVNANTSNFPTQPIAMLTANLPSLQYALSVSPRIGVRVDCLGASGMSGAADNLNAVPASLTRWQTAPFITEWCAYGPGSGLFPSGDQQVSQYHVSMLSSGNYDQPGGGISGYSSADQAAFADANKLSGYRYVLDSLSMPTQLSAGTIFQVKSVWENVNVAPTYQRLDVELQLRNSSGAVVWQAPSGIDLRTLLPTNGTPLSLTDTFNLPALASGTYTASVQVLDPDGINRPLNLAIAGRQADGSYSLGTVQVQ
ncbi:MAG: DUF4832 domain-containing protein [Chloroflexota bacterium]